MTVLRLPVAAAALLLLLAACDAPLDLGQPTTRALESGAASGLDQSPSFRVTGSYGTATKPVTVDLEVIRPKTEHLVLKGDGLNLEGITIGAEGYYRGPDFLASHVAADPGSRRLVAAAGDAWWKGQSSFVSQLPDFTHGAGLAATFLGPAANSRADHLSIDGQAAVELSGPRGDVFIGQAAPFRLLEVRLSPSALVDGLSGADLHYSDYGRDFGVAAPSAYIDFADLSTLPPLYTVVSVDTSACDAPCTVSASVLNRGGARGAKAPSTVTFSLTDAGGLSVLGTCVATIRPDVGYGAGTTASCVIGGIAGSNHNAAVVTAVATNPGG